MNGTRKEFAIRTALKIPILIRVRPLPGRRTHRFVSAQSAKLLERLLRPSGHQTGENVALIL